MIWRCLIRDLTVLSLLLICASGCQSAQEQPTRPSPTPSAQATTAKVELLTAAELSVVIPKLNRGSKVGWGRKTTLIPGHLSTWLLSREQKRPLLIVTVDDLNDSPERLARLREMSDRVRGFPAEWSNNSWIRVLAGDRFEVVVRALDKSYLSQARLSGWVERLNLKTLSKLNPQPND